MDFFDQTPDTRTQILLGYYSKWASNFALLTSHVSAAAH